MRDDLTVSISMVDRDKTPSSRLVAAAMGMAGCAVIDDVLRAFRKDEADKFIKLLQHERMPYTETKVKRTRNGVPGRFPRK